MGALIDLIPGGWLAAGGAVLVAFIGAVWKAFSTGKNLERAKHDREKIKAHEQEMDRVARANQARDDAVRRSNAGGPDGLRDEWTRPDK